MNIRKKLFFKNYKIIEEPVIEFFNSYNLKPTKEQKQFLKSKSHTVAELPRRSGKTTALILDAIYNSKIDKNRSLILTRSNIDTRNIYNIIRNFKGSNNNLMITCSNLNTSDLRGYMFKTIYIDEYTEFPNINYILNNSVIHTENITIKAVGTPTSKSISNLLDFYMLNNINIIKRKDK